MGGAWAARVSFSLRESEVVREDGGVVRRGREEELGTAGERRGMEEEELGTAGERRGMEEGPIGDTRATGG